MQAHQCKALAAAMLATLMGACASKGGDRNESAMDATRGAVSDAATTPLRDVGLIRPDVPDVIETLRYPYSTTTLAGGCPAILYEIGQLDAVLGVESYQPGEDRSLTERGLDEAGDAALGAVRDAGEVLPFRSWVRRASGAARAERDAARAIELGVMRRAFLRGYGAALGCRGVTPSPPPAVHNARNDDDPVQTSGNVTPP